MKFQKILNYTLIALIAILAVQLFAQEPAEQPTSATDIRVELPGEVRVGTSVALTLTNQMDTPVTVPLSCPDEPFDISRYENGQWVPVQAVAQASRCESRDVVLPAGESLTVNYQPWQADLFTETGRYRVAVPLTIAGEARTFEAETIIAHPNFFARIWETFFYRPIYNALIYFIEVAPGHSFAIGIILLTIAMRVILLWPFQSSMVAQRRLQKLQPEIAKLKATYKDNQQMLAMETMALYKKNGVNPFSSCLPILIQMPFFIAIFQIVMAGLAENNLALLYQPLSNFAITTVDPYFFGLNLLTPNIYILPVLVGLLQWGQLRLAMAHVKKQNAHQSKIDDPMAAAMADMQKYMQYILPVMIAVFTATAPAAVGLYWAVSTIFGIGQQVVVNKVVK